MAEAQNQVFLNYVIDKGSMKRLIGRLVGYNGNVSTAFILDQLKSLGFEYATRTGISLGIDDLLASPSKKLLVRDAERQVRISEESYQRGSMHAIEKLRQIVETWHTTSEFLKREMSVAFNIVEALNPVHMMSFSGARGSTSQVHQLVGMRGLMSDPQGRIIDLPIQSNLREGLSITEYIISCYGARKGVVDTAIRTADAGYLTRRLVEVAQHLVIRNVDCHTVRGVYLRSIRSNQEHRYISCQERLVGRVLARSVNISGRCIASRNEDINSHLANRLIVLQNENILIRSPLTCKNVTWTCQLCYGWNSNYGKLVKLGEAVGIIAGQSIGEPGTQLTLRTFHTGGVFTGDIANHVRTPFTGIVHFDQQICDLIRNRHGRPVWQSSQDISVVIQAKAKTHLLNLPKNTLLLISNNQYVESKQVIAEIRATKPPLKERIRKHIYSTLLGQVVYKYTIGPSTRPKDPYICIQNNSLTVHETGHVWILSSRLSCGLQKNIFTFNYPQDFVINKLAIGSQKCMSNNQRLLPTKNYSRYSVMRGCGKLPLWNYKIQHIHNSVLFHKSLFSDYTGVSYSVDSSSAKSSQFLYHIVLSSVDLYKVFLNNFHTSNNKKKLVRHSFLNIQFKEKLESSLGLMVSNITQLNNSLKYINFIGQRTNLPSFFCVSQKIVFYFSFCFKLLKIFNRFYTCSFFSENYKTKIIFSSFSGQLTRSIAKMSCLLEQVYRFPNLGQILFQGTIPECKIELGESGKVICVSSSLIVLRLAQCHLLVNGTKLHAYCNEVIIEQQALMTLIYEQLRASDIVQGLPKAEQLLEARLSNEIVLKLDKLFDVWTNFLCGLSHPCVMSTEKSLESTQVDLVDRIQTVYLSQGIQISDKHVEVIVRQMTSKVLFTNDIYYVEYNPIFLPGELIELSRARKISSVFEIFIPYRPVLLGITKASLNNESFIAAASFQRTTKVLSTFALQNKMDWIKGLQENVVFGGMIPAGTGCEEILFVSKSNSHFNKMILSFSESQIFKKKENLNIRLSTHNSLIKIIPKINEGSLSLLCNKSDICLEEKVNSNKIGSFIPKRTISNKHIYTKLKLAMQPFINFKNEN